MRDDDLAKRLDRILAPLPGSDAYLVDRALREEVDRLCTEACLIEDPIESEVNFRLRATLLRIADSIKESL